MVSLIKAYMKKNDILCLVLALLLGIHCNTAAQDFMLRSLPTQRLLPSASIHCLFQDSEGYIWYGTDEGGLCRDNGYQIDVLRPSQTRRRRETSRISCIAEDTFGNILFGTADGLFAVSKRDYSVERVELDSSTTCIEALFTDSQGDTWIGVKGRVYKRNPKGETSFVSQSQIQGRAASIASFFEDKAGNLFVLQWGGGLLCRKTGTVSFQSLDWPLKATPLQMIEDPQEHCYWVLTSGAGIQQMELDGKHIELTAQTATLGHDRQSIGLSMLRNSRNGLFWVTTLDNLYVYSLGANGQLQPYSFSDYLPAGSKILDQLMESREGDIYVAGYTPHTFIISPAQHDLRRVTADAIRRQTGFPVLADRAVYDGTRYIWIWQGRQGLMLYDREGDQAQPAPRKYDRTLQHSSEGGIWASSGRTLFHVWHDGNNVHENEMTQVDENEHICCLLEHERQTLYIATNRQLYCLALAGRHLKALAELPEQPSDMCIDRQGNLYLALGTGGLYRVTRGGQGQRLDELDENLISVCAMPDGSLWASTFEGNVYHYDVAKGAMTREPLLCGTAAVKCIRVDGLGHVWTLTDQKVTEFSPQNQAFRTLRNTDPFVDVSYFYSLENIDATHVGVDGAGALIEVQSSGELTGQAANGIVPRLASFVICGETRFVGQGQTQVALAADEEDLTLQLTTLDHLHAANVSFAYLLEGITRGWVFLPQGTNSILLTNLPHGDFRLHVMATDRYGCWSQPVQVVTLSRAAHWYETWWAYLIYICLAIAVVYAIWRLERRIHLLRRLIKRRQEVRLDEIEMKREDIDALKRDADLLHKAIAKIEEHLADADYNVQMLSDDLCMSRITLYRRIQELTGQSPTDFIRDIRLKKAAQLLLQSPDATIADIARKVGFSTPKYFSRCFREKFGQLPTEYRLARPKAE